MSPLSPQLKALKRFLSSRDGTQRLQQTAWHSVIRPHWPPHPLLPSSLPSAPKPSPVPRLGPSKQCQYCVLLNWPPPHTCLTSTPASSPPDRDRLPGKCPALQPSLCRLSPKSSLELPPHWRRSYRGTKQALFWFLYLPLSLQTAASPLKQDTGTAGTLWELPPSGSW